MSCLREASFATPYLSGTRALSRTVFQLSTSPKLRFRTMTCFHCEPGVVVMTVEEDPLRRPQLSKFPLSAKSVFWKLAAIFLSNRQTRRPHRNQLFPKTSQTALSALCLNAESFASAILHEIVEKLCDMKVACGKKRKIGIPHALTEALAAYE